MELKVVKAGAEKKYELTDVRHTDIDNTKDAIIKLGGKSLHAEASSGEVWYYKGVPISQTITFYSTAKISINDILAECRLKDIMSRLVSACETIDNMAVQIRELQEHAHGHTKRKNVAGIIGLTKETEYVWK